MPTVREMPTPTSTVSDDQPALDPLGRRSLYWATGGKVNDESKKRRGRDTVPLGKHALYSHALLDSRRGGVRTGTSNAPGGRVQRQIGATRTCRGGLLVMRCTIGDRACRVLRSSLPGLVVATGPGVCPTDDLPGVPAPIMAQCLVATLATLRGSSLP